MKGEASRSGRRGSDPEMLKKKFEVTPQGVVDLLNEALRIDPHALCDLCEEKITVNRELALHPTIQCVETGKGRYEVGLIGFLNGLFGIDEKKKGAIRVEIDPKTKQVIRFEVREPWQGVMGAD